MFGYASLQQLHSLNTCFFPVNGPQPPRSISPSVCPTDSVSVCEGGARDGDIEVSLLFPLPPPDGEGAVVVVGD